MTKRGPPRHFRQAEDSATDMEAGQSLLGEFSSTVSILERHFSVEALCVVLVRNRTSLQQFFSVSRPLQACSS